MKILMALFLAASVTAGWAASTIDTVNRYAYGANIGWLDARADGTNGAVIGEFVCSGYLYSANVGWINLGSGSPANTNQYQNTSASDFGVNHDGLGNLRGYAYGANIGWINFAQTGAPTVDLNSGRLSGFVYSANCGWISLSNAFACVQTDTIQSGADSDGDGIPDAWEIKHAGNLTTLSHNGDADGDGISDYQEYLADTDPLDAASKFRIVAKSFSFAGGTEDDTIIWTCQPSRNYELLYSITLLPGSWISTSPLYNSANGTITGEFTSRTIFTNRNFRVQALRPLAP